MVSNERYKSQLLTNAWCFIMITDEEFLAAKKVIRDYLDQHEREDLHKRLYDGNFTVRSYNILKKEFGMYFRLSCFASVKKSHIESLPGVGKAIMKDIEDCLAEDNIKLL